MNGMSANGLYLGTLYMLIVDLTTDSHGGLDDQRGAKIGILSQGPQMTANWPFVGAK